MPLSHEKPNDRLMAELLDVRDAVADVESALQKTNWLPDDFEKDPLRDILAALKILPDGTAAGANTTLRAIKVELQDFEDRHFLTQTQIDQVSADQGIVNKLSRHNDLGKTFRLLKSACDSALAECRRQAGTRPDEEEPPENEMRQSGDPAGQIRDKAQIVSAAMRKAHLDIDAAITEPLPEKEIVTRILVDAEQLSLTTAAVAVLSSSSQWVSVQLRQAWRNIPKWVDKSMGALIAVVDALQYAHNKLSKIETEISDVLHNNAREIAQDLQLRARIKSGAAKPLPPIPPVDPDVQEKAEEKAAALLRAGKTVPPDIGQYVRKVGDYSASIVLVNFEQLKHCPYLAHAYLDKSTATNFTTLSSHLYLKRLDLHETQLTDLTFLSRLTQLERLYLDNTPVSDLTPLRDLTQLRTLSLDNTSVSDVTPLQGLTQLDKLFLNNTSVSDVMPLRGLTQLQALFLNNTSVKNVTPLSGPTRLKMLYLDNTSTSDVTPLQGLSQLQDLSLDNTPVSDVTPLRGLMQLQRLWLENTSVTDWSPVDHVDRVLGRPENWPRKTVGA